jgi:malate dehydrogenase (oxaloacetate-decarboxylating)
VLIGTTGQPGDFTPQAIRSMAQHCDRPIIFPLSNPTSQAECTPSEAFQYSGGRALVATGSPFEPLLFEGRKYVIGQCNNVFVFPGVGLGTLISEASHVSERMFLAAARALAEYTTAHPAGESSLYPNLRELRAVTKRIAFKVAQEARDAGLGRDLDDQAITSAIERFSWTPDYDMPESPPTKSLRSESIQGALERNQADFGLLDSGSVEQTGGPGHSSG